MNRHVRLDTVGGIAGDMFAAAMLDAFPETEAALIRDLGAAGVLDQVDVTIDTGSSGGLAARRFAVTPLASARPTGRWREIREFLASSRLEDAVKGRALSMFGRLAVAEAAVHGTDPEDVHFHELADWDSIADIVAAASLSLNAGIAGWSVTAIPIGRGTARTEHGVLPVPAPAAARLLEGFRLHDDGIDGERVTPTGAAIVAELVDPAANCPAGRLGATGLGAGTRELAGTPNILRVIAIEDEPVACQSVARLEFEVDDMTPEEVSVALERIRADPHVLDGSFQMRMGKKGRAQFSIAVLTASGHEVAVADLCFDETATLGVRIARNERLVVRRAQAVRAGLRVKDAERPSGVTSKVESDDLTDIATLKARRRRARDGEDV